MYCIITVECYWHCSDGTVHYKSDKTVNFCGFRGATTSPITVFMNVVFTFILRSSGQGQFTLAGGLPSNERQACYDYVDYVQ